LEVVGKVYGITQEEIQKAVEASKYKNDYLSSTSGPLSNKESEQMSKTSVLSIASAVLMAGILIGHFVLPDGNIATPESSQKVADTLATVANAPETSPVVTPPDPDLKFLGPLAETTISAEFTDIQGTDQKVDRKIKLSKFNVTKDGSKTIVSATIYNLKAVGHKQEMRTMCTPVLWTCGYYILMTFKGANAEIARYNFKQNITSYRDVMPGQNWIITTEISAAEMKNILEYATKVDFYYAFPMGGFELLDSVELSKENAVKELPAK